MKRFILIIGFVVAVIAIVTCTSCSSRNESIVFIKPEAIIGQSVSGLVKMVKIDSDTLYITRMQPYYSAEDSTKVIGYRLSTKQ